MNIKTYLNHQMTEDRRAFVVHYPAKSGKTQFALQVSRVYPIIHYLDLQKLFLESPDLPPIADCDPITLGKILLRLKANPPVILVDNMDFLFNTWEKEQKLEFLGWLNRTLRSPAMTEKTLMVILQDDPVLTSFSFDKNIHGEERLLTLDRFDAA